MKFPDLDAAKPGGLIVVLQDDITRSFSPETWHPAELGGFDPGQQLVRSELRLQQFGQSPKKQ